VVLPDHPAAAAAAALLGCKVNFWIFFPHALDIAGPTEHVGKVRIFLRVPQNFSKSLPYI
jgi:hypothetical protein